jgi:hypothetical protein
MDDLIRCCHTERNLESRQIACEDLTVTDPAADPNTAWKISSTSIQIINHPSNHANDSVGRRRNGRFKFCGFRENPDNFLGMVLDTSGGDLTQ